MDSGYSSKKKWNEKCKINKKRHKKGGEIIDLKNDKYIFDFAKYVKNAESKKSGIKRVGE